MLRKQQMLAEKITLMDRIHAGDRADPSSIINRGAPLNPMHFFPLPAVMIGGEVLDMVSNTGAVAKAVLLILLAFSVISWAIILTKWSLLRRARVQSGRFVRAFRKAQRMQDIAAVADQFRPSPLVGVFEGGYEEYKRQIASNAGQLRVDGGRRGMQIGA